MYNATHMSLCSHRYDVRVHTAGIGHWLSITVYIVSSTSGGDYFSYIPNCASTSCKQAETHRGSIETDDDKRQVEMYET